RGAPPPPAAGAGAWQGAIPARAESPAGYRDTDVYPPADGQREEWVIVIHFDDEKSLQQWLGSKPRAEWIEKLRAKGSDFELKTLPGGFGPWFAGLGRRPDDVPPSWKIAVAGPLRL